MELHQQSYPSTLTQCLYLYTAHFHHVVRFTFAIKLSGYLYLVAFCSCHSLGSPTTHSIFISSH